MEYSQAVLKVTRFVDCVRFYRDLLGCEVVAGGEDGPVASLVSGGQKLTLLDPKAVPPEVTGTLTASPGAPRVTFAFKTDDVDAEFSRLKDCGIEFTVEPHDFPAWGVRSSICLDPDGNPIEIAGPLRDALPA
jgi:catechol 2,3-dioxygenase-like lactoylglutathione lyase family enzyme